MSAGEHRREPLEREPVQSAAPALPWPEALPWLEAPARELIAGRARLPHALLIHGRRGIGKLALALQVAQALLCESPRADDLACGACASCRYAVAGQHPDLFRLELAVLDEDTGEFVPVDIIKVDRVLEVIAAVALSSHRRGAKVIVIAPAERMNLNAANALLKTLEEPPPATYFLLVAEEPGRVPPTILSRCRQVPLGVPERGRARAWLVAHDVSEPDLVLAQAAGAPLTALTLSRPEPQRERRTWLRALAEPERIDVTTLGARIDAASKDERKARLGDAMEWMLAWTSDLARVQAGATIERNPDFGADLAALAGRVAPRPLFRYHRSLLEQRARLSHPLAPRLVAEAFLLDYCALFAKASH